MAVQTGINKLTSLRHPIKFTGIVGIIGAVALVISDMMLLAAPVSGQQFFGLEEMGLNNVTETNWRISIGVRLSLLMPLYFCGLWQIYQALKPGDWRFSLPTLLLFGYAIPLHMVVDLAQIFFGSTLNAQTALGNGEGQALTGLLANFETYLNIIQRAEVTVFVVACIWFTLAVVTQKTYYPQWVALLTPALIVALVDMIARLLPAPYGGYLAPTSYNLAFLLLFVVSTILLWPKTTASPPQSDKIEEDIEYFRELN